jgi:hypothetical protein
VKPWEALKALEEGQEVEWRWDSHGRWLNISKGEDGYCIFSDRQYRLKPREPQVVEFELDCREFGPEEAMTQFMLGEGYRTLEGKRWRIVATEVVE